MIYPATPVLPTPNSCKLNVVTLSFFRIPRNIFSSLSRLPWLSFLSLIDSSTWYISINLASPFASTLLVSVYSWSSLGRISRSSHSMLATIYEICSRSTPPSIFCKHSLLHLLDCALFWWFHASFYANTSMVKKVKYFWWTCTAQRDPFLLVMLRYVIKPLIQTVVHALMYENYTLQIFIIAILDVICFGCSGAF